MHPQALSAIGLTFDILGVLGLFFFGPPTIPLNSDGHRFLPFNANDPNLQKKNKAKYRTHQIASFIALGMLLIGFILQLISSIQQIR